MGSFQSKPKAQVGAMQQPPSPSNDHLRQVNPSDLISSVMDTIQREGSVRQNLVMGSQWPSMSTDLRGPPSLVTSPVDSHSTSTAVATDPHYVGYVRSWDHSGRHRLLPPEGKEHSNKDPNLIVFQDLYRPGDTVFKKDLDTWRAYKVKRVEFHPPSNPDSILVHSYFLDFDKTGQWLVPHLAVLVVPSFLSKRSIEDLDVIPGSYFDDNHSLRQILLKRGHQYAKYAGGVFYRGYTGDSWPTTPRKDPIKVVVDYTTGIRHGQDVIPPLQYVESGTCSVCSGGRVQLQSYPEGAPHDPDICQRNPESAIERGQRSSGYDSLLYCPPKLWAFSMSHKCWKMVLPEHLVEVQRQDDAIHELCMIGEHRDCLESMISHLDSIKVKKGPNVQRGKRQGLNILLTGNSGTGKTFAVETLAKKCAVPLYKIACNDLGSRPDILESKFNEALLRAANWGAILLLDEADIFLDRSGHTLAQNVLVSTLLCQLESSDCVIFMTTHKPIGLLDEAILSRLHLTLRLPDLTFESQKKIWCRCIRDVDNLSPHHEQDLDYFIKNDLEIMDHGAFTKLNGRQIKNCVAAALAVALNRETTLEPDHITRMLRLGKVFRESVSQDYRNISSSWTEDIGLKF